MWSIPSVSPHNLYNPTHTPCTHTLHTHTSHTHTHRTHTPHTRTSAPPQLPTYSTHRLRFMWRAMIAMQRLFHLCCAPHSTPPARHVHFCAPPLPHPTPPHPQHTNPQHTNPTPQTQTPFHVACKEGHAAIVSLMLAHPGVDTLCVSDDDSTTLSVACEYGRTEVVELLLKNPVLSHEDIYNSLEVCWCVGASVCVCVCVQVCMCVRREVVCGVLWPLLSRKSICFVVVTLEMCVCWVCWCGVLVLCCLCW